MRAAAVLACAALCLATASCSRGDARPEAASAPVAAPADRPAVAPAAARAPQPAASSASPRAAAFSGERAWAHLEAQLGMGPRAHGHPGHEKLRAYLEQHLRSCGADVQVQAFSHRGAEDSEPQPFWNVMGRFRPEAPRWILLGTHYDTRLWADEDPDPAAHSRPIQGANDGASGTAVLLEIATVLKDMPPDIGVEIVFFDGEDYGRNQRFEDYFLGSTALAREWAKHFGESRPECVVVLDMVGDADLAFRRETKSQAKSPWVNDLLWSAGASMGISAFTKSGESPIYDDQDAFLDMGIPSALLIDYEYPWWHQQGDMSDKCSPSSLRATGSTVLAALVDHPPVVPAPPSTSAPASSDSIK